MQTSSQLSELALTACAGDILGDVVARNEAEALETFGERYGAPVLPAALAIEKAVLGSDYGASGFTTSQQADHLAESLAVGPGDLLLDIGAGCGWPGLHIAKVTGCAAVLSDITVEGVRRALRRAQADGMDDRIHVAAASARHLPFRPECFDAIVHTDVLC